MPRPSLLRTLVLVAAGALASPVPRAQEPEPPATPPAATLDLATAAGARPVAATWRYRDARVVEVPFRDPGPDGKPTGAPNAALDIEPKAGAADFDDAAWEVLAPEALGARRTAGRLAFGWYRLALTLPETIAGVEVEGATAVLDLVADDYAEVWVDGRLPLRLGQRGGPLVAGWNAPNRVVLAREARPGQEIRVAVFAANGPLSSPPANYVWIRSAKLELHRSPRGFQPRAVDAEISRLDPALDAVIAPGARFEKLGDGFRFTEGPVWTGAGGLLFSDPNANRIYRWLPEGRLEVFREFSGYSGPDVAEYAQPGSNGLTLDAEGRLTACEHGNRRVTRTERDGSLTVLADRFEGRRLNSPNDLVYRSDGALFFTDPAFGLPKWDADPRRELPWCGVYALAGGVLKLVAKELKGPNGLAFSPDERFLYVANWDPARKVLMRYPVRADATLGEGGIFADLGTVPGEEALDGVKVDRAGNVFVSGPSGVWIFSSDGRTLGTLKLPELAANFAWGGDGRMLYLCARTGLYRVPVLVGGAVSAAAPAAAASR